jgi:hypothetical protein
MTLLHTFKLKNWKDEPSRNSVRCENEATL